VRNPKDLIVSTLNHLKNFRAEQEFVGTFEELVEEFLRGKFWFGAWWDHVDQYASLPNIHLIQYESLLKVLNFFMLIFFEFNFFRKKFK
jgi:hypothetical protein